MSRYELLTTFDKTVNNKVTHKIQPDTSILSIQIDTTYWTPAMFYELPLIKIELYNIKEDNVEQCKGFPKFAHTYNPSFPTDLSMLLEVCEVRVKEDLYIILTPIFDTNALIARNKLIDLGIEKGDYLFSTGDRFSLNLILETF